MREHSTFLLQLFIILGGASVLTEAAAFKASVRGQQFGLPARFCKSHITKAEYQLKGSGRLQLFTNVFHTAVLVRGGGMRRAAGFMMDGVVGTSGRGNAVQPPKSTNRLRDAVFPIYGSQEVGKFLALAGIQFFIIFVLTLTRDLKDTLIITSCGAEAISFLKVWQLACCICARQVQRIGC